MPITVTPIAGLSDHINDIRLRTGRIVNELILPNESLLWSARRGSSSEEARAEAKALRQEVQDAVKSEGLWAPHLPPEYGGMGLDFMAHAYMNEILAYAVGAASLFGVVAPNSGNQTVLVKYGTEEQKRKWLLPLVEGTMQSGFSMTEPENAGSDPRSIQTTAVREGDEWVINGHKWFTSNGLAADFFIVMCRAKESADDEGPGRMVQIIVPTSTPGVEIVRGIGIWGSSSSDHCEVRYTDVRVPFDNALGQVGDGHRAAQDRLGAGRIFHCMNSVGQMWRAFDLMVERMLTREVHGGLLKDKQFMQGFVADSYMDLQSARLMTIHAAEKVDAGDPQARTEISAIKVFVPAAYLAGGRPGHPGLGRGRRDQRPAPGPDVPRRPDAPPGRRPRRGAPHPHRQERAPPLRERRELGLRRVTAAPMTWQPGPAVSVFAAGLFDGQVAVVTGGGSGLGREVAHAFAHLGGHPSSPDGRRPGSTRSCGPFRRRAGAAPPSPPTSASRVRSRRCATPSTVAWAGWTVSSTTRAASSRPCPAPSRTTVGGRSST